MTINAMITPTMIAADMFLQGVKKIQKWCNYFDLCNHLFHYIYIYTTVNSTHTDQNRPDTGSPDRPEQYEFITNEVGAEGKKYAAEFQMNRSADWPRSWL